MPELKWTAVSLVSLEDSIKTAMEARSTRADTINKRLMVYMCVKTKPVLPTHFGYTPRIQLLTVRRRKQMLLSRA
ncbi:hypothetical protein NDU88_000165 [Pleurodeles waltl]|uniref:Uncharacterized protein n=1 Tax=Pleurodeles waltl TaxID=8319 RepID=A0AAV7UQA4_PLEWA|nr:hypothetical protein NDU88_000165 [Pleurodeles waltl]